MNDLVDFLEKYTFFASLSAQEKTKILPKLSEVSFQKEDVIFEKGKDSDVCYFIVSGEIQNSDGNDIKGEVLGFEGATGASLYKETMIAKTDLKAVSISNIDLAKLLIKHPKLSMFLLSGNEDVLKDEQVKPANSDDSAKSILAWIFASLVPFIFFIFAPGTLDYSQKIFISLFCAGAVLWLFNTVHESIPALLIVAVTAILGITEPKTIVSGFSSDTALLFLSLSGLSATLITSGLLYRLSILLVRFVPSRFIASGVFVLATVLMPVIPSNTNRAQLIVPIIKNIMASFSIKKKSIAATKLAAAGFFGAIAPSNLLITGSLMNFVGVGFLREQDKFTLDSVGWLTIALVPVSIIILTNILAMPLVFHSRERPKSNVKIAADQLKILGPINKRESYGITAIVLFLLAMLTIQYHFIPIVWISVFMFIVLLALGCVSFKDWSRTTNWGFFLFICSATGLGSALKALRIDEIVIQTFLKSVVSDAALSNVAVITALIATILLLRLILPLGPSFVVMMTLAIPLSELTGISLIVFMFTILIVSDIWFAPYQAQFYTVFENEFDGDIMYDRRKFLMYNMIMNAGRILAIYISLPYWQKLGIM